MELFNVTAQITVEASNRAEAYDVARDQLQTISTPEHVRIVSVTPQK